MNNSPFTSELDSLKRLYREETKKLYQALLGGAPWPALHNQKLLLERLSERIGFGGSPAAI